MGFFQEHRFKMKKAKDRTLRKLMFLRGMQENELRRKTERE
jgi:hypothetical protein